MIKNLDSKQIPENELYNALLRKDAAYDGHYFVCVKTTGIFCKFTCSARKPLQKNVVFTDKATNAQNMGFRACKRCKPLDNSNRLSDTTKRIIAIIDENPQTRITHKELKAFGFDSSTVRRNFKRDFGISFTQFARSRRLGTALTNLSKNKIIEAQLDAGFESQSGFFVAVKSALGKAPAKLKASKFISCKWLNSPIGPMLAIADESHLLLLEFAERKALLSEIEKIKKQIGLPIFQENPLFDETQKQLDQYFTGDRYEFTIPTRQNGSQFYQNAWKALAQIPFGETRFYSSQAAYLDMPNASRAVAQANGANKIAIIIPCHRIIGKDGNLTGYGGGLWRKDWLLKHEAKCKNCN